MLGQTWRLDSSEGLPRVLLQFTRIQSWCDQSPTPISSPLLQVSEIVSIAGFVEEVSTMVETLNAPPQQTAMITAQKLNCTPPMSTPHSPRSLMPSLPSWHCDVLHELEQSSRKYGLEVRPRWNHISIQSTDPKDRDCARRKQKETEKYRSRCGDIKHDTESRLEFPAAATQRFV